MSNRSLFVYGTYRVATDGFNAALATLGCYLGDR